jgi:hypothetical protein
MSTEEQVIEQDDGPTEDDRAALVASEPPGNRTPQYYTRLGNPERPRPREPLVVLAELVRGRSYCLSYGDGPVWLAQGRRVRISAAEHRHLEETAVDELTFVDPVRGRVRRCLNKFAFFDAATGEPLPERKWPDEVVLIGSAAPLVDEPPFSD